MVRIEGPESIKTAHHLPPSVQRIAAKLVAGVIFAALSLLVKTLPASLFRAHCSNDVCHCHQ